jgi:DNA mismatch repair ATPase MutS
VQVLEIFMDTLRRLRAIADEQATGFASEGFRTFFTMVSTELDDDYLARVDDHLRRLQFRDGVLISAQLGKGNKGIHYVLRKPAQVRTSLLDRLTTRNRNYYTLTIPDRDESGARALSDLKGRGIGLVASAMARSTDHILAFLTMLRTELGFYVGCLNLAAKLAERDEPTSFPTPVPAAQRALSASGLYDICLALRLEHRVVANNLSANQRSLIMVTGANQGGKSTFLRSVGLAQLMTQAGMFAPAESLTASVCSGLFTHYKREEDTTMTSGKLDEELGRMSTIADHITTDGLLLCNESFAATNEREGSQISADIIHALQEAGIRIVFVTHLYDLAERIYDQRTDSELFLRAERQPDGRRTYKLAEGAPLPTSYGADLYRQIFNDASA